MNNYGLCFCIKPLQSVFKLLSVFSPSCSQCSNFCLCFPPAARDHGPKEPVSEAASLGHNREHTGVQVHAGGPPHAGPADRHQRLQARGDAAGDLGAGQLGGFTRGHPEKGTTSVEASALHGCASGG